MSMSYAIREEMNLQTVLWAIGGALYRVPGVVRALVALLVWCLPGVLVLGKVAVCVGLLMAALAATIMFPGAVLCVVAIVAFAVASKPK
jgi:hypothetical protein